MTPGSLVDGRYRVEARVGSGGFGVVYAAFHLALERRVALKILRQDALARLPDVARSEAIARFVTEGRTLTRLRHPNIVSALDFGTTIVADDETSTAAVPEPYLVLEWCEGETLASFVKRRGPLPLAEACALFEPIVDGMAHAHASRVVHRDLKPANVMVVRDASGGLSPRIVDFGIAQIAEGEAAPSGDTRPDRRGGPHTPGYAAPEQIAAGRTGPWTDVHALGLLFVELVTGLPPFDRSDAGGDDDLATIDVVRPTPGSKGVDVGALEPVMVKALSLRPAARYADAGALLAAFREARGLPLRAAAPAAAVPLPLVAGEPGITQGGSVVGAPGQTQTDEGVGANVPPAVVGTRRKPRWMLGGLAVVAALALGGFGVRTAVAVRAARGPTDPSDGQHLCALTNDDLRRRLARAGAVASYTADYGALARRDPAERSVYFGFPPDAVLSGVHVAAYSFLSGEAWVASGRYSRRQTPQNPSPAVFATRGSCTLVFTGHASASPEAVRRAFDLFRHGLALDVVDEWPGKPATSFATLPAWELEERAVAAGLVLDLAVTDDREGQLRFREPAGATLRMTSDAPTMASVMRLTATAYVQAGPKILWVEGIPPADAAALIRRVLGPLAEEVIENTPAKSPPSVDPPPPGPEAWRAAPPEHQRRQGQLVCEARALAGYRRAVCHPARPGVEITLQVMGGSFETVVDEADEVGMMFRADSAVRLAFSAGKDKVIYDSAKGGKLSAAR